MRQDGVTKIDRSMQAVREKLQAGRPAAEEGTRLAHALQLYACSFRRAMRKAVQGILSDLAAAAHDDCLLPSGAACAVAAAVTDLLGSTGKAIRALEHVSSHMLRSGAQSLAVQQLALLACSVRLHR